jgi:hypothetical protein
MKKPVIGGSVVALALCLFVLPASSYADSAGPPSSSVINPGNSLSILSQPPTNPISLGLREDLYFDVPGITVADLTNSPTFPNLPDATRLAAAFETVTNLTDNYGVRLTGFLVPPLTGQYVFYICSDDQSALFLSTNEIAANKVLIASDSSWSMPREWTTSHGQPSAEKISTPISLAAGRSYYIEALMKEGGGGDYLGVTWKKPGGATPNQGDPPIPGEYLRCRLPTNVNFVPTVTIVQPTNGFQGFAHQPIQLGAVAFDREGPVASVAFYANDQKLGNGTFIPILNSLNEYYELVWTNPAPGNFSLTAVVVDNSGLKATSAPVNITVVSQVIQPTVTVTATQPVAYAGGQYDETNSGVFTFSRKGMLEYPLLVSFAIGGTASNGIDYLYLTNVVSIPAGQTNADVIIAPFELVIPLRDMVLRAKTVTVSLLPDQWFTIPYLIGNPSNATVTIFYPEIFPTNLPVVTVTAPDPVASENPGNPAIFRIFRTGSTNQGLAVYFQAGGTASNGLDYPYLPGSITIPAGRLSTDLVVTPIDDNLKETTESLEIRLIQNDFIILETGAQIWPPIYPNYIVGEPSVATAYIYDNDSLTNNLPPSVKLVSPTNGAQFKVPTNLAVIAEASDPDGHVQSVDFYYNGTNFLGHGNPMDRLYGYGLLWSNPPVGRLVLTAKATDDRGASTVSVPVAIYVSTKVSELTIFSPTNGSVFQAPTNIWIQATAVDPNGYISRVEFYAGTNLVGISELVFFRAPDPGEVLYHSVEWKNVPVGNYTLTARARDTLGQTVVSPPVSIMVEPRTNQFLVKRFLPAAYRSGVKLTVKLETAGPSGDHAFAIEDQPPVGWVVGAISHNGVFDGQNHKVKYGPFFTASNMPSLLTYEVTPPAQETGTKTFTGRASMDGRLFPISGQTNISRLHLLTHPADINPTNYSISISELTAYVQAWLTGKAWPIDPSPITAPYVTKAISLWRNGEAYKYNAALEPPQCWISLTNPVSGLIAAFVAEDASPAAGLAIRTMPASIQPGGSTTVNVTLLLNALAEAYVVQEQIPPGWWVTQVNQGGQFDAASGHVKWAFLDGAVRPLSYQITAPADASGLMQFQGSVVAAVGNDNPEILVGGRTELVVSPEAMMERTLVITRVPSSALQIALTLVPGQKYALEASTDLATWTLLTTLVPTVSNCQFVDNDTQPSVQRFYRVKPAN